MSECVHLWDLTGDPSSPLWNTCVRCGIKREDAALDCPCCGHPHCGLHDETPKIAAHSNAGEK